MKKWYSDPIVHTLGVVIVTHTVVHYHLLDRFISNDEAAVIIDESLSNVGYVFTALAAFLVRQRAKLKELL